MICTRTFTRMWNKLLKSESLFLMSLLKSYQKTFSCMLPLRFLCAHVHPTWLSLLLLHTWRLKHLFLPHQLLQDVELRCPTTFSRIVHSLVALMFVLLFNILCTALPSMCSGLSCLHKSLQPHPPPHQQPICSLLSRFPTCLLIFHHSYSPIC